MKHENGRIYLTEKEYWWLYNLVDDAIKNEKEDEVALEKYKSIKETLENSVKNFKK